MVVACRLGGGALRLPRDGERIDPLRAVPGGDGHGHIVQPDGERAVPAHGGGGRSVVLHGAHGEPCCFIRHRHGVVRHIGGKCRGERAGIDVERGECAVGRGRRDRHRCAVGSVLHAHRVAPGIARAARCRAERCCADGAGGEAQVEREFSLAAAAVVHDAQTPAVILHRRVAEPARCAGVGKIVRVVHERQIDARNGGGRIHVHRDGVSDNDARIGEHHVRVRRPGAHREPRQQRCGDEQREDRFSLFHRQALLTA